MSSSQSCKQLQVQYIFIFIMKIVHKVHTILKKVTWYKETAYQTTNQITVGIGQGEIHIKAVSLLLFVQLKAVQHVLLTLCFVHSSSNSAFYPSGVGKWVPACKGRYGSFC